MPLGGGILPLGGGILPLGGGILPLGGGLWVCWPSAEFDESVKVKTAALTARLIFDRRDLILIVAPLFIRANIAKMKLANF